MKNLSKYAYYLSRVVSRLRYFPWRIPVLDIINKTLSILHVYIPFIYRKMDKAVLKFLEDRYGKLIDKYKNCPLPSDGVGASGIIWTCWWQGEENAPLLVQKCLKSIRQNAGGHKVVVITFDNVHEHVKLSENIWKLAKSGKISLTHLSDVLRMKLLAEHGGMWLDSTMFYTIPLEEKLWDEPYFSPTLFAPNSVIQSVNKNVFSVREDTKISICLMTAQRHHPFFELFSEFYELYFDDFPMEVHYLFTYYFAELAFRGLGAHNSLAVRENKYTYIRMLTPKDDMDMIASDFPSAHFYQITYKQNWAKYTKGGKLSVYGRLISGGKSE